MFLQPAWQRKLFCVITAAVFSGSASALVLRGMPVGLLAALVVGTVIGRTLRPWSDYQPLIVTIAMLLTGLGAEAQLSSTERQLVDLVVGTGMIWALWPSGGRRQWRAITASVRRLSRRWSRAIPIR